MGESRNAYRVLVGRPEGKRPLGRPRRRWEDNIKMDLREVGYDDGDWIDLAQDRGLCEGGNEPSGSLKACKSLYRRPPEAAGSLDRLRGMWSSNVGWLLQHLAPEADLLGREV
ncbi:hypothetical protein ANN_22010 [Periplaneta americana]|uniref:Uncharacterized protein n=1 Tax=Periplaneta americana TaxID=6978 RepID=A0ABQ8S6Z2_PERAM|nr:hypothetical protein ANN_22010 [Periplaneta americana]